MDRKRAAAALLALAACIACSSAAPTASNQTALELMDGPSEGCYYNFQHYGEGDRIMTNEPCLNCTCHNRMLMCYLRVCPFTKPIGQDCTVEKRADQCCPIVTCPDVPVDLLTSTSTSSPAEYGTTGVGKLDKYGCSINGKYFSEGSKVPSTPNKPCEHCYCIRNMTTCVMQECTLHVDGCTPIYHKDVCCPVRYSCDHPEDEILLLDDMTTTVRPTPGFLLTTTTSMPVTQLTQDCVHDDQIFPDGTLIKTEKACEHCYCMKGDIVCVVQECGTPMENEGKNCTSLPPRHGQCCPDTYICEGDDHSAEITTEIEEKSTQPPRRVGVEGSGYRNEPDEPFTETGTFETDVEGSGEDYATDAPIITVEDVITEKIQPDIIDEMLLATTEKEQTSHIPVPDKDQNTIPEIISDTDSSDLSETVGQTTETNIEFTSIDTKTTVTDEYKTVDGLISKEDNYITTESAFRKEDNSIVSDEILTIKEQDKLPTTAADLVEETTLQDEHLDNVNKDVDLPSQQQSTTVILEPTPEDVGIIKEKETTNENQLLSSSTEPNKPEDEISVTPQDETFTGITTIAIEKIDMPETTSINPDINEVDENISIISPPGRIPGEGDCLLNGVTYKNNTIVPSSNNCHTSCKCTSSIIKCDPIICSSPPEYMENMNDCQPIYDSPDACCPTYVCSSKETIPPQSHSQMSGTESPKPITTHECNGQDCILNEEQKPISEPSSSCTSVDCLNKPVEKQDQNDCSLNDCANQPQKPLNQDCPDGKCQVLPVVACEGENCINEPVTSADSHEKPSSDNIPSLICNENGDCKISEDTQHDECKDEICKKQESTETEMKVPSECLEPECKTHQKPLLEESTDLPTENISMDIKPIDVTQISLTELDANTEVPEKTISTLGDDDLKEISTPEVTKDVDTFSSEKLTTISPSETSDVQDTTDKTELTESPTVQSIPEKTYTKITEETNIEHVTESLETQDDIKDKEIKVIPTEKTTDKAITDQEISEHTEMIFEDKTDKMEITTDVHELVTDSYSYSTKHDEIYATTSVLDTENQKGHTDIPKLDMNDIEKISTTEASLGISEEVTTEKLKEISEVFEIKEEKTELPTTLSPTTAQREEISTDFNKVTEINELLQVTHEPHDSLAETYTEKEKTTETPELYETHEMVTDENSVQIGDVTRPSESYVTGNEKVTTDKTDIMTESNIIPTDLPQSMQTKLDEVIKDVTQEILTDKHEIHTESPDYYITRAEVTASEPSYHHVDSLSTIKIKSEATEEPITEKMTVTEISDIVQTETEPIIDGLGQAVTEIQEVTESPNISEKLDEIVTTQIIEKEVESTVTEKLTTTIIESTDITEKQVTYSEISKEHTTPYEELIIEDHETKVDSSTELPILITTLAETTKITEGQEVLTEEPEKTITEKDSRITDDMSPEIVKASTTEVDQHFTEKSEIVVTESTPAQYLIDDSKGESTIKPASSEPNEFEEQDLESQKLPTTIQDNVVMHEITTVTDDLIPVTESHTKSPLLTDEKPQESSTEIENELSLQTDVNNMDTVTEQWSKNDDSYGAPSTHPTSRNEDTTEHYATEPQKIDKEVTEESKQHLDSSTKPSLFDHKIDVSIDTSLPHEETEESKVTTVTPQDEQEVVDKEPTLFTEIDVTSQDMEKTTPSLVTVEEKETESQSYTSESYINVKEQETVKPTNVITIDEPVHETTEKTVSGEESLPDQTHEYIPQEGITEDITSQTLLDISTEKTKLQGTFETVAPVDIGTTQSELITKSEESGITESALFEKETVTELPHSYITSENLDKTTASEPKDTQDENINKLIGSEEDSQLHTTPITTKYDEEKEVTKTPISVETDDKQITEALMTEKNEIGIESTTKVSDDQILEEEKDQPVSDSIESHTEVSEKSTKDAITQQQETSTDKIIVAESPDYLATSDLPKTTISTLEEVKIPQQETTTEKVADQTESLINIQSTVSELHTTEGTPIATTKEGIRIIEEEKTTPKSKEDFEQVTSQSPGYQTTILESKDEIETELPQKEISTIPPKLLEPGKIDEYEITEIISDEKLTTMTPEIHHEIVTDINKSPESVDVEAHIITTETNKPSVTERNEIDIVTYSATDIPTDNLSTTVTDSKEYEDNQEQEQKITKIPVFTELQSSTDATKVITEAEEILETESQAKETETTQSQFVTVAENNKESSTETSGIKDKDLEHSFTDDQKLITPVSEDIEVSTVKEDSKVHFDNKDKFTTSINEDTSIIIEPTKPTIIENEKVDQPEIYSTQSDVDIETEKQVSQKESDKITTESVPIFLPNENIPNELPVATEKHEDSYVTEENKPTTNSEYKFSETTPFSIELEEHTHPVADEITTKASLEEIATTMFYGHHESQQPERGDQIPDDFSTDKDEYSSSEPSKTTVAAIEDKEQPSTHIQEQIDENILTTVIPLKPETEISLITEKTPMQTSTYEPIESNKDSTIHDDDVIISTTSQIIKDKDYTTESIETHQTSSTLADVQMSSNKDITISSEKPEISEEILTSEIPKATTSKVSEETSTHSSSEIDNVTKPKEKPVDTTLRPVIPDVPKPEFIDENNQEIPSPDFPPSSGYGQEPDYIDEDQAFGPGTCRYGGKVYVSAQQIPRDDPCDFCFCFRSDIICLQQSCPPPIHGCHEEPIQGFCCPRYECPVSMATTLNVTTTTTTTTTTLPPHFLPHAYKGAAQRRGCQIKGIAYKVGEVVRASSGPCLHCTCGGDGQMKCDPKPCTPEPMLRQMIAAAVSAKRRR